jgi:hypothetical protein
MSIGTNILEEHIDFIRLEVFFPEDGGSMFLRNFGTSTRLQDRIVFWPEE